MRTIIIGDIHGCSRALDALLTRIRPAAGRDRLVFLGDLFDRGPDSREVFMTIRKLSETFGEDMVLMRGNHEDYLLQRHLTPRMKMIWEQVGRQATVRSFELAGEHMEDTIPWLEQHLVLFYRDETIQCVHAGLLIEPIEANDQYTLLHDHEMVLTNRYAGRITVTGHIALDEPTWFAGDEETTEALRYGEEYTLPASGVICIDTGCGKGGRLTAMTVEGNRFELTGVPETP